MDNLSKPELQEDYEKEFNACEAYTEKFISMKSKVKRFLSKPERPSLENINVGNDSVSIGNARTHIRLPELKLNEFDGDPRLWLNFWNSFQKIHEDEALDDHSKFVYLIQATKPKSKAREIVESFQTTSENYSKVVRHLKDRFGREDMLIQIYVRDLLQLVLSNNSYRKDFSLSSLYDNLETKLRALE